MTTELHDALAQAADAGRARFDSRDAAEVITPATRRVSRHRTAVRYGSGLASVVVIGALLWGVDAMGATRVETVDPAVPTLAPGDALGAETLLAGTTDRRRDESSSAMAALRCDMGEDNPHLNVPTTPGNAYVIADCAPVWAPPELSLASNDGTLLSDPSAGTITYDWVLRNNGAEPVLVDRDGIVAVLTTESTVEAEEVAVNAMSLQATTTWTLDGAQATVVSSASDVVALQPGAVLTGTKTWESSEEGDLIARVVAGQEKVVAELQVRIAPSGEASGTEFIALTDSGVTVRFTGEDDSPVDVWTPQDLEAIAEPRAQGETRNDATAGMVCEFADPETDPRMLAEQGKNDVVRATEAWVGCDPVWFVGGPVTSTVNAQATITGTGVRIASKFRHDDDRPLSIDYQSAFAWLETNPSVASEHPHVYSQTAIDTSMWTQDGKVMVELGPDTSYTTTVNGTTDEISISEVSEDGTLQTALATPGEYTLSFWGRIHDDNPAWKKTYMIQLGESTTFSRVGG